MARKSMVNFYIDPHDEERLVEFTRQNSCSKSEAIRRAVKRMLANHFGEPRDGKEGVQRVVGGGST